MVVVAIFSYMMTILSLILVLAYISVSSYKSRQIPPSISETAYLWAESKVNWFTVFCVVLGILILPPWLIVTPEVFQFLAFLGCAGLIICGTSPLFRENFQGTVHIVGFLIAIVAWLIWMILSGLSFVLLLDLIIFGCMLLIKADKWILWLELIAILTIIFII